MKKVIFVGPNELHAKNVSSREDLLASSEHPLCWRAIEPEFVDTSKILINDISLPKETPFSDFMDKRKYRADAVEFFQFQNVVFYNNSGAVLFARGRVWTDSSAGIVWSAAEMKRVQETVFEMPPDAAWSDDSGVNEIEELHGTFFLFSHASYTNYGHFILDCCSALIPFLDLIRNGSLKIITTALWYDWQKKLLSLLEIPEAAIVSIREPKKLERAIFSSTHTTSGTRFPNVLASQVFHLLGEKTDQASAEREDELIYLKRSDSRRKMAEEDDVEHRLSAFGFRIVRTAELSISEQVNLMRRARMVVGIYGASFTNVGFCKRDCCIFEIRPDFIEDPWVMHLAARMGLKYAYYICRAALISSDLVYEAKSLQTIELGCDVGELVDSILRTARLAQ